MERNNIAVLEPPRTPAPVSLYHKQRRLGDGILTALIYLSAAVTVLVLVGLIAYILIQGVPHISFEFLSTGYSALEGGQRGLSLIHI